MTNRYRPYTGVGSRKTPDDVGIQMLSMAETLARNGFTLRSGAAPGADSAFEAGADRVEGLKEIYKPWEGFGQQCITGCPCTYVLEDMEWQYQASNLAAAIHPAWDNCSPAARSLHTRNVFQVLGYDLKTPSLFLICWTKGANLVGGTRTAIMVARKNKVPVFNLGDGQWTLKKIVKEVKRLRSG